MRHKYGSDGGNYLKKKEAVVRYVVSYVKKYMIRVILGLELLVFMYIYLFGSQGTYELVKLRAENNLCMQEHRTMYQEYEGLQKEVMRWEQDDFVRGKMAREKLQMAHKDDEIYYLLAH